MYGKRLSKKSATLFRLAHEEFGKLWYPTSAEEELLAAVTTEGAAVCGPSGDDDDPGNNPEHAKSWLDERKIHANLIRWLCVDHRARDLVDPNGVWIYGAVIVGELNLTNIVVPFSLSLDHCAMPAGVSLLSAEIPRLNLQGTWIDTLLADTLRVKSDVLLTQGFCAEGQVRLQNAQIGGNLDCSGGKFLNGQRKDSLKKGIALNAAEISVGGDLFFQSGFRAEGKVLLMGAQVGGDIVCIGGEFINPSQEGCDLTGIALAGDRVSVKGSVFLQSRFEGEVRLLDSHIGGILRGEKGQFINPVIDPAKPDHPPRNGEALGLNRAVIAGTVYLDNARAEGRVRVSGAHIDSILSFRSADFTQAELRLEDARVGTLIDADSRWPKPGHLYAAGFVYRTAEPSDADMRLRWLDLQAAEPFFSQPYLQLAKALGDAGDDDGKTKVLIAMKDREWAARRRGLIAQIWRWPFKITAGYGYDPLQALWEILGLSALGWIIYRRSYLAGGVTPTEKDAYLDFKKSGLPPDHHPKFSPLIYSVENSLPLVKLEQADKWEPDPSPQKPPAVEPPLGNAYRWPRWLRWLQSTLSFLGLLSPEDATRPRSRASRIGTSSKFVRVFLWVQILLGWLLATLFLAGISGIIKKE